MAIRRGLTLRRRADYQSATQPVANRRYEKLVQGQGFAIGSVWKFESLFVLPQKAHDDRNITGC